MYAHFRLFRPQHQSSLGHLYYATSIYKFSIFMQTYAWTVKPGDSSGLPGYLFSHRVVFLGTFTLGCLNPESHLASYAHFHLFSHSASSRPRVRGRGRLSVCSCLATLTHSVPDSRSRGSVTPTSVRDSPTTWSPDVSVSDDLEPGHSGSLSQHRHNHD